jgi:hypothetical protein
MVQREALAVLAVVVLEVVLVVLAHQVKGLAVALVGLTPNLGILAVVVVEKIVLVHVHQVQLLVALAVMAWPLLLLDHL